jgi:hypothetical protein
VSDKSFLQNVTWLQVKGTAECKSISISVQPPADGPSETTLPLTHGQPRADANKPVSSVRHEREPLGGIPASDAYQQRPPGPAKSRMPPFSGKYGPQMAGSSHLAAGAAGAGGPQIDAANHPAPVDGAGRPQAGSHRCPAAAVDAGGPQPDAPEHGSATGGGARAQMDTPECPAAMSLTDGPQTDLLTPTAARAGPGIKAPTCAHAIWKDVRTEKDAALWGAPGVHRGRPDFSAIVEEMRTAALTTRERRVAVLGCGPGAMVSDLRRVCRAKSGGGVTLDFHSEVFEF